MLKLITKLVIVLSSISRGLEFWSVNNTSIQESSEAKGFENIKFSGEISNSCSKDLLGTNVHKTLEFCWYLLTKLKCINTASAISKLGTF